MMGEMIDERFDKRGTRYRIVIRKLSDEQYKQEGGRYQTTVIVGDKGETYPLNLGYKDPSYIAEKYGRLTGGDVEVIADKLNKIFNTEKGKKVLKSLPKVKGQDFEKKLEEVI